jgi:hypothetical protein
MNVPIICKSYHRMNTGKVAKVMAEKYERDAEGGQAGRARLVTTRSGLDPVSTDTNTMKPFST